MQAATCSAQAWARWVLIVLNERLGLITCGKGADTQAPLSRLLGTRVSQAGARCRLGARQDPKIAPTPSPCLLTPAGTPGDRSLPCALGAGVSSRSWVGYSSKATGTKRTAPRTTKPSGRGAASCCLRSRWVPPTQHRGMGAEDKSPKSGSSHQQCPPAFSKPGELAGFL